ncbi:hypothetical protein PCE1_004476 [Barthelona sp. PCE]
MESLFNSAEAKKLKDCLRCAICRSTMNDPTVLRCGHVFCRDCAEQMAKSQHKCSLCNATINHREINRSTSLLEILNACKDLFAYLKKRDAELLGLSTEITPSLLPHQPTRSRRAENRWKTPLKHQKVSKELPDISMSLAGDPIAKKKARQKYLLKSQTEEELDPEIYTQEPILPLDDIKLPPKEEEDVMEEIVSDDDEEIAEEEVVQEEVVVAEEEEEPVAVEPVVEETAPVVEDEVFALQVVCCTNVSVEDFKDVNLFTEMFEITNADVHDDSIEMLITSAENVPRSTKVMKALLQGIPIVTVDYLRRCSSSGILDAPNDDEVVVNVLTGDDTVHHMEYVGQCNALEGERVYIANKNPIVDDLKMMHNRNIKRRR